MKIKPDLKPNRRLITSILALVLALCLAAGCAGGRTASDSQSAASSSAQSSAAPSSSGQSSQTPAPRAQVRMGLLKGPSGMGAACLMERDSLGETRNDYDFTLSAVPSDMVSQLAGGALDIACIPSNSAAALYNKTDGAVRLVALSTGSVLYILEKGDTVNTVADLAGRTIYATGQAANPEYVLRHILESNGLTVGTDVFIEFRESDELSALAASGAVDLCMLPVPAATTVLAKNSDMREALDLTVEWEASGADSIICMGAVAARADFLEKNPDAAAAFLADYEESIASVLDDPAAASALVEKYEIIPSAAIAAAAMPKASIIFVSGAGMKDSLEGYLEILFKADPASVGGALPDDSFYYIP